MGVFFILDGNGVRIEFFGGVVGFSSPTLFPLCRRLTVFFAADSVHSIQNSVGKNGMAVDNAFLFYSWRKRRPY